MKLEDKAKIFLKNNRVKVNAKIETSYNNTIKETGKNKGKKQGPNKSVDLVFLLAGFARSLPEREANETCPDCTGGTKIVNGKLVTCGTCGGTARA